MNILTHLPHHSFLPIAHVSRRFHSTWIEMKHTEAIQSSPIQNSEDDAEYRTNPMSIGNLFNSSWHAFSPMKTNSLNTNLLQYYVENGYNNPRLLKKVMLSTASRGDIQGMHFIVMNKYCLLDDEHICTMAGAAGQLEALKWLRGDLEHEFCLTIDGVKVKCPWDPTELHREAAENSHDDCVEYVEKNCDGHQIQTHYGVGLPW